ncbi:isochorismatase family protein [Ralstonia chuxiongensis]|uniref:Cysteine hydrolase n=1 Tax=Ralstonia chuxiongensis TaxID=2957504 RepID=A0AA42BJ84_9RALS|nr:isochorismatase family protein [Ralstonia chuxiongensis]MCP1174930.1 cysteine hydrolase [Ralstonia chuxiongensis]
MLNRLLNAALSWYAQRGLRAYHHYPADKTAVVFVDAQRAFVKPGTVLAESLTGLARLARTRGFLVVHAPMATLSGVSFPTLAHREIERALSVGPDAPDIAPAAELSSSDVLLPKRSTLSIFGLPEVDALIKSRGLEHLILAGPLGDLTLDSSLRDAVQRDLHVTVVSDCVAASSTAALELELRYTMPRYAHLVTGIENLERLFRP